MTDRDLSADSRGDGPGDRPDDPVVRATLAFAHAMRPPETGTLAEWEAQQHAAYEALMQAVEEYLMKKEAERATDS